MRSLRHLRLSSIPLKKDLGCLDITGSWHCPSTPGTSSNEGMDCYGISQIIRIIRQSQVSMADSKLESQCVTVFLAGTTSKTPTSTKHARAESLLWT